MTELKPGDSVVIRGSAGQLWEGRRATVLHILPKGTMAECRVSGEEPRHGEVYPAFPVEWLTPAPEQTPEEHKARHVALHAVLEELVADFLNHTGALPSRTSVMQLMEWSHQQTQQPTEQKP